MPRKPSDIFRDSVKGVLEKRGISIAAFAEMLGLSRQTVYPWFREENPTAPSLDNAVLISARLEIPLSELVGQEGQHTFEQCWQSVNDFIRRSLARDDQAVATGFALGLDEDAYRSFLSKIASERKTKPK